MKSRTFETLGLSSKLTGACKALGWNYPTRFQADTITRALEGEDILGIAPMGSGKTGGFVLPILHLLEDDPTPFSACVVSQTRDSAVRIADHFEALGSAIGVKCGLFVENGKTVQQAKPTTQRPHIIIGTSGGLIDLFNTQSLSLKTLKYFVLSLDWQENWGLKKPMDEILNIIPRKRQTFLFCSQLHNLAKKLRKTCLRYPVTVEASAKYSIARIVKQELRLVSESEKDCYLVHLVKEMYGSSAMIFSQTCQSTRMIALMLTNLGIRAIAINSQMGKDKRLEALGKFKTREYDVLVTTRLMCRNLQSPHADLIIGYDIPSNAKEHVDRVARAERTGLVVSLVEEHQVQRYLQIGRNIGTKLELYTVVEKAVKKLAKSVAKAKRMAHKEIREYREHHRRKKRAREDDASSSKMAKKKLIL